MKDRFVLPTFRSEYSDRNIGKTNLSVTRWNQRTQPFSCKVGVYNVDAKVTFLTLSDRDNPNLNLLRRVQCGSSSNTCTSWSGLESAPMSKVLSDSVLITSQMGWTRAGSTVEDEATH